MSALGCHGGPERPLLPLRSVGPEADCARGSPRRVLRARAMPRGMVVTPGSNSAGDSKSQPVDYITLAGLKSPGLAEVVGLEDARQYDVTEGHGVSGGLVRFMRRKLARFSVRIQLFTPQEFVDFYTWKGAIERLPKRGVVGEKSALDIWHPFCEMLGIGKVVVESFTQPDQSDTGMWTFTIKLLEVRETKVTLAKVVGSKATPVDPIEVGIIQPLLNQMNALATE